MPAFSPIRFYHELRRRRMIKVTLIYLAGAWAVIGACDLLLPQLVVDVEAAMRIVFALAIVQLPVALVFGWLYDVTDQGIQRTAEQSGSSSTPDTSLHRRDHLLIGTLSTAVVAILATGAFSISQLPRIIPVPPENSIAVLPFEICTDQELDIRLAPALAMEVINHLAERAQLKVIARQSSFTMAGFGLSLPEIAEPLGVRYLLQGELCRDGETRTLSVTLFDEDGTNVWAQRYQQQTDASERITQTLPSLVADGVAMQLGGVSAIKAVEPVDREAYEQLLIGREHRWQGNHDEARAALERALEIQPDYAEAVFEMALMEARAGDSTIQNIENAWPLGKRALALAEERIEHGDRSFETHFAAGRILANMARWERELTWRQAAELSEDEIAAHKKNVQANYAKSERYLRSAIVLNPSLTENYVRLFNVIEWQGPERRGEALEILEQGLDREPFNISYSKRIATRWAGRGRYREAMELLERFRTLPEIPCNAWGAQVEIRKNQSRYDEMGETLIEMLTRAPEIFDKAPGGPFMGCHFVNRLGVVEFLIRLELLGLSQEAGQWYLRVKDMPWMFWLGQGGLDFYLEMTGQADDLTEERLAKLAAMSDEELLNDWSLRGTQNAQELARSGQVERAIRLLESLQHTSMRPDWAERAMWNPLILAELYLDVGRDDDAAPLLEEMAGYLESEYDSGIRHPDTLAQLADIYAMQKRDDEALAMLRKAVDYHWNGHVQPGNEAPDLGPWARLRDDPRFIVLLNRMEADLEQQAIRIRAMLAEHDVDELLAPLMALSEKAAAETQE